MFALIFSLNNLIAYAIYFKNYFLFPYSRVYSGEKKLIECIKYDKSPSLNILQNKCNLGSYFRYFQEKENFIHPSIIIKDRDDFAQKILKPLAIKTNIHIHKSNL